MKLNTFFTCLFIIFILSITSSVNTGAQSQTDPLRTPLSQELLDILTNEISGQFIYNNLVTVAGAPWMRDQTEFEDTFHETYHMFELVKSYGINRVNLERYGSDRTFNYPVAGELWITSPEKKLIARLGADAALVAGGSQSADVTGELIYIPPMDEEEINAMLEAGLQEKYNGKIALMWSHPRGPLARALDAAGIQAVISFSSRERYVDPGMVVYSSGSYSDGKNLKLGFTVSWQQWSELMEDVEYKVDMQVRCMTKIETRQDKFETIFSWIPGRDPEKKGVIFTAHLFEGYTKRGANDNAGGCLVQLEILRALTKLIETGQIEQPGRNIYFLWPNEISGTYEFIKNNPDIIEKSAININMDMVTEGLRLNNAWLTFSETPNHLPSFYDGLAKTVLNYVWRTNDIVYLGNSPGGRRGGQYFPKPMTEKNGSVDAFRFYMHSATGGSDHICFNNPSVAVPGIEYFTWPDYWYHADTDTPPKGDPTQMKRIAFIGAATAYAAANCTDEVLPGILEAISNYGYSRVAERELPDAISMIANSTADNIGQNISQAVNLVSFAADREISALESVKEICTGSKAAVQTVDRKIREWELYKKSLEDQIMGIAGFGAEYFNVKAPVTSSVSTLEKKYDRYIPVLHPDVKFKVFSINSFPGYQEYMENYPDSRAAEISRSRNSRALINYINGKRSITRINNYVSAETRTSLKPEDTIAFFEMLRDIGYITF